MDGTMEGGSNGDGGAHWTAQVGASAELVTEKVRSFRSVDDLLRSYESAQKLIGGKGMVPPGDGASAEQLEQWYAKVRPQSADGYEWAAPEEWLEGAGEEEMAALEGTFAEVKGALHRAGLDKRQFAAVMDTYAETVGRAMERQEEARAEAQARTLAELKGEWGDRAAQNLAAARQTARALGVLEALDESGAGDHPAVLRALHAIHGKFGEAKLAGESGSRETLRQQFDAVSRQLLDAKPDTPGFAEMNERRGRLGRALFGG